MSTFAAALARGRRSGVLTQVQAATRLRRRTFASDLTILDPIVTTVGVTARNHGYMVFDTLFGMDGAHEMQPQMLEGFSVEDDTPHSN